MRAMRVSEGIVLAAANTAVCASLFLLSMGSRELRLWHGDEGFRGPGHELG